MFYLLDLIASRNAKTRRVLKYWGGVTLLYLFCDFLVCHQVSVGAIPDIEGLLVVGFASAGAAIFYMLLRFSEELAIKHWKLVFAQAAFAMIYAMVLYVVLEPIRGGVLIGLPLIILMCAFSLRPSQIRLLSLLGITALACVTALLYRMRPLSHPGYVEIAHFLQATIGIIAVSVVTGKLNQMQSVLRDQKADAEHSAATIRSLAITDELTQLANRRHMKDLLALEESRTATIGSDICLAILDVDFFKNINDLYGHAVGDSVLRSFSDAAKATLRPTDVLARWGGEEFLLFMPFTKLEDAIAVVKRVADRVHTLCFPDDAPQLKITFSAGVIQREGRESFADAIRRSDRAMYTAKTNGRNRVVAG